MPWGCVGTTDIVGTSGPGKPNCGLPGTFNVISGPTPPQVSSQDAGPFGRASQG